MAAAWIAAGAGALLVTVPACSSSSNPTAASTTTTSTTAPTSVTLQQASAAEVADCESDGRTLEEALGTYMAEKGVYPSPPSPWSAASYAADFTPLTAYLPHAPTTKFYVIEYDSQGHVWVAPPGSYSTTYNPGQSFDANENICLAAVR